LQARPILDAPIARPQTPPTILETGRAPDAVIEDRGVRLELWLPETPVATGEWLPASVRVTNTGKTRIEHFGELTPGECSHPIVAGLDVAGLFDPGEGRAGNAAAFEREFLGKHAPGQLFFDHYRLASTGERCDRRAVEGELVPGGSFQLHMYVLPMYSWRSQPLPSGSTQVTARFEFERGSREIGVEVSSEVLVVGSSVEYPSPQSIVDAMLSVPEFAAWLETGDLGLDWNVTVEGTIRSDLESPITSQGPGNPAPVEYVRIAVSAEGATGGGYARFLIDPWAASVAAFELL